MRTRSGAVAVVAALAASAAGLVGMVAGAGTAAGDPGRSSSIPAPTADEAWAFDPEVTSPPAPTPTIREQDLPARWRAPDDAEPNASWVRPQGWVPDVTDTFDRDATSVAMRRRLGGRYGGEWVNGTGDGATYVYGALRATAADTAAARQIAGTDRVAVANVAYSTSQLAGYAHRVEGLLVRHGVDVALLGVQDDDNAVRLQVASAPQSLRDDIADVVPADAVEIIEEPVPVEGHSTADAWRGADGRPYYEGGLRVNLFNPLRNGWSSCQTAFYVFNNAYGPFGMTAGHCSRNTQGGGTSGQPVTSPDGSFSSSVGVNAYGAATGDTNSDSLVFSTASAVNNARIWCPGGSGCHWGVMGIFTRNYPKANETICRSSIQLNNAQCAPVTVAGSFLYEAGTSKRVRSWCANPLDTVPGDSGGPWYRYYTNGTVRAAGVNWSGSTGTSCFSHIYYATQASSTSVVIQ